MAAGERWRVRGALGGLLLILAVATSSSALAYSPVPRAEGTMQMRDPFGLKPIAPRAETPPGPGGSPFCEGDGVSGSRIQAVYGYLEGAPSEYTTNLPVIRTMAAAIDDAFDMSAGRQGGSAHPRWATEPDCELSVLDVELPANAADDINATIGALDALGLMTRTDRKYVVWVDAEGTDNLIATTPFDEDPNPATNDADGGATTAAVAQLARNGGWDTTESAGR